MEELKMQVAHMTKRQRIEFFILLGLSVVAIIAVCFIIYSTWKSGENANAVDTLRKQNEQLIKNNERLLGTVRDLNASVNSRELRDSIAAADLARTAAMIPSLNSRLDKIDVQYGKSISAVRTYSVPELEEYARAEAARLRRDSAGR